MYLAAGGRERAARGSQRSPGGGCGGQRLPPEPPTMAEGGSAAPEPTSPQREPEGRAREASATNLWFGADHRTSAITSGGLWTWVIVAWRPTTSDASSKASSSMDAGVKPRRRTERGSPPTVITLPRCWRAWLPQYHM